MGQHLCQDGVGDPPVQDVGPVDAMFQGVHAALDLGDHAPADDAAGQQGGHLFPADLVDQRTVVLGVPEDAPDVGEEDELFRPQGDGQLRRCGVGVDVVGGVVVDAQGHGGDHGDVPAGQHVVDHLGLHLHDLAHQAVLLVQLLGLEEGPVQAAQADGLAPQVVDDGHQVLVHLPAEDLLDDVHGLLIGVPQAVHEPGLLAHLFQHVADLRPAAVDHHHPDAHQVEQDDVADHRAAQLLGDHGVAAVLDDDGLAVPLLNVGQGLHQDGGALHIIVHVHGWVPPGLSCGSRR